MAQFTGRTSHKYKTLYEQTLKGIKWKKIDPRERFYFFIPQTYNHMDEYNEGFALQAFFVENNTGVQTGSEKNLTDFSRNELSAKLIANGAVDIGDEVFKEYTHKAFDTRWMAYFETMKDAKKFNIDIPASYRSRHSTSKNMFSGDNIALICGRSNKSNSIDHVFISSLFSEVKCGESTTGSIFMPLYRYETIIGGAEEKIPNFDPKIYTSIKKTIPKITPEKLLDYIYAILHSPSYRSRYAEFLKSDFPRIPYPKDVEVFNALAKLGGEIRALHLLKSTTLDSLITSYPVGGDHEVIKPRWEDTDKKAGLGRVYINTTQHFDGVPKTAWEFFIGGYQPAQKWLKDRQGRNLTAADIKHWQRVIVALSETDRIMKEIDKIEFLP